MLTIFSLMGIQVHAQNSFLPVLTEGKVWYCAQTYYTADFDLPFTMTVCGDTIAGEQTCKKLCFEYGRSEGYPELTVIHGNEAAWEDDGALYYWGWDDESEDYAPLQVCNFGLNVGDDAWNSKVVKVDTIEVRGVQRRRLTLDYVPDIVWVEGIGVNIDKWPRLCEEVVPSDFLWNRVDSCYEDGKLIFTKEDFFAPAVTNGISTAKSATTDDDRIYDLSGRRIECPNAKGIYIKKGRKILR